MLNRQRREPRPPAPVPINPRAEPEPINADAEVIAQLEAAYDRIQRGSLKGFIETLGPVRNNPAPETVPPHWIIILNQFQQEYIVERTTNLRTIQVNGVLVYEDNREIYNMRIFDSFPEYKQIHLDNYGSVIVPEFDATKVMEIARMLNFRISRPLTIEEYFDNLKRLFDERKDIIIEAKQLLDGSSEIKEIANEIYQVDVPLRDEDERHIEKARKIFEEQNPGVINPEPPSRSRLQLRMGQRLRPKRPGVNTKINKLIKLIKSMKKYPENSDLENYLLLSQFLSDEDVDKIWILLERKINDDPTLPLVPPHPSEPVARPLTLNEVNAFKQVTGAVNFEAENTNFFKKKFRDTEDLFMNKTRQIIKRRLLSLFILISRNSTNSTEKVLNDAITDLFFSSPNDRIPIQDVLRVLSRDIVIRFEVFIKAVVTQKYLNSIINGDFMNKIYKNEKTIRGRTIENLNIDAELTPQQKAMEQALFKKEQDEKKLFPLSEMLIRIRTKLWLTDDEINMLPISYIFDKYSEEDRKTIMREKETCAEIAKLTNELGNFPIPKLILPTSLFTEKTNEGKITDSTYFLESTGPNILKDIQRDRRTRQYRESSPSRRGGKRTRRVKRF